AERAGSQFELPDGEVHTMVFTVMLSRNTNPGPTSVPSSNRIARLEIVAVSGSTPAAVRAAAISAPEHKSLVQPSVPLAAGVAALQPRKTVWSPLASVTPTFQRGAPAPHHPSPRQSQDRAVHAVP